MQNKIDLGPGSLKKYYNVVLKTSVASVCFCLAMLADAEPPLVTSTPIENAEVGQPYSYAVIGEDPEGGSLSFSFFEYPAGMTVDVNGLINWTPTADQSGNQFFNLEVQDQEGLTTYHYVDISVFDPNNQAPQIGQEPITITQIGDTYTYSLNATDVDGDTLTYSSWSGTEMPGASISADGVFSWTPTDRDLAGEYWVTVEVFDGRLGKDQRQFILRLEDPTNQLPIVGQEPLLTANVGESYIYNPQAIDPDGDTLSYSLNTWPQNLGIQLSQAGVINWTPTTAHVGENWISIKMDDGHLGIVEKSFELVVLNPNNQNPEFTSLPSLYAQVGVEYSYQVQVSDPDGNPVTLNLFYGPEDGMSFDANTNTISWTPDSVPEDAEVNVIIDARDDVGGFARQKYIISVSYPDSAGDLDGDGVPNGDDAFPNDPSESVDTDGDGIGNNSDTDDDGDGVDDTADAFPLNNSESLDTDGDGTGNNADSDDDNDGVADVEDAFPLDLNESSDLDGDGIGDNSDNDRDGDGVANTFDAFPSDPAETTDTDGDGIGNNADSDDDEDGVTDNDDAFPLNENESVDTDLDGIGNNADTDDDGDSVADVDDSFPLDSTEASDLDNDGIGDNADTDRDGDGVPNDQDAFPNDATETEDTDSDGLGNNTDTDDDNDGVADTDDAFPLNATESSDLDGDGIGDNADTDRDGDGVANNEDAFPDDPSATSDFDGDGVPDNIDPDRDGDGVNNDTDAFPGDPTETVDSDFDGLGNNADADDDNDGVADVDDAFPLNPSETLDTDGDGIGNNADNDDDGDGVLDSNDDLPLDATESVDTDGDGIGNNADNDDDNDAVADAQDAFPLDSAESLDTDVDGIGNNSDTDDDNDGVADINDDFPLDPGETTDSDSDGIGNNADTDDDNDGVLDGDDAFPLNPSETLDTDNDGVGNNSDTDDDNDGVVDTNDAFPLDASESTDTDADGIGDNADSDDDNDGVPDADDAFPTDPGESSDLDGDGIGDNSDTDRDGDGVANDEDAFPNDPNSNSDLDGDGIPDSSDTDRDGDGIDNDQDAFPGDPTESIDTDTDGIGNNSDTDDDNDGVLDNADAFPLNAAESLDTDNDGTGNNADTDDDNDGVNDTDDRFPLNSEESSDFDNDGVGDNADTDDDNDGVEDSADAFPRDASESSDIDGDGTGDNADTDRDGDGVENDLDAFPSDSSESSDLDNDGIGDNSDTDRDGDGVANDEDVFPNDPALSQLPVVQNFAATVSEAQAQLTWIHPVSHHSLVAEYRVYRGGADVASSVLLATVPAESTGYSDTGLNNGQAYGYRVVAVTSSGLEGLSTDYETLFVAYNNLAITALSLDDSNTDFVLSWGQVADTNIGTGTLTYRIYRAVDAGTFSVQNEITQNSYTDTTISADSTYRYRVAAVIAFVNPLDGATVTLEGTQSNDVAGGSTVAITAALENALLLSEGEYQIVATAAQVVVSGNYLNASGAVDVIAQNTQDSTQTFSSSSTSGNFQLSLPFDQTNTVWAIELYPQMNTNNRVSFNLNVVSDTSNPVVSLNDTVVSTNADTYTLNGSVSDALDENLSVVARSSRFTGTEFQVNQAGGGFISVDIPLLSGANVITVIATDASGNSGEGQVSVTQNVSEAPVVEITSPLRGAQTVAEQVDVAGVVYSSLPASDVRISLGGDVIFPDTTPTDGAYSFTFAGRSLNEGQNIFTVQAETPAGTQSATVTITRIIEEQTPLSLTISSPATSLYTRDDLVTVSGFVRGGVLPVTLLVNGVSAGDLNGGVFQSFQTSVDISGAEGEHVIAIVATDAQGEQLQQNVRVVRDITPPAIVIASPGVQPAPAITQVTEIPYPLTGTVVEANIAALTINGRSIALTPSALAAQFEFNAALNLSVGTDETLTVVAQDLAGNQQQLNYIFNATPETIIDVASPVNGANFALSAADANVAVLARLSHVAAGFTASVAIDGNAAVPVAISSSVINTSVPVDITNTEHELVLEVRNAANNIVATTRRQFTTENIDNIALAVRVEPVNGDININPNDSVKVYFNRPIDPSLLEIEVRETVSGLTITVERDDNPSDFPSVKNAEPVMVNRVQERVAGSSGVLPGNTVAIFHPSRIYAYGAKLFVAVRYNGEQLIRSTFQVRDIPTFMQATVIDQQGQPLSGIPVAIPAKGLSTVTNANGSFSFGFGLPAEKQLTGGQVNVVFNQGSEVPNFGEISKFVYLQTGHLNRVGTTMVPLLSRDIAYRPITSGQASVVLAKGELTLDLSQAELLFPDGRDLGSVHVQFTPTHNISHSMLRSAMPQWLFALQPAGIEIDGEISISMKAPALTGSYDYLPTQRSYVVMVGLDPDTLGIVPTGIGILENNTVTATLTKQRTLDYLGYVIVAIDQSILQDTMEGRMTLEALITELDSSL